jgi:hypothetical protein
MFLKAVMHMDRRWGLARDKLLRTTSDENFERAPRILH